MFLKALITVFTIPFVSGQAVQFDAECHILQTLDDLKARIDQQNTQISTLQTSLASAEARIETLTTSLEESSAKSNVIFHVRDVAEQPTKENVIKFLNVVDNTDDVYDLATGCFTAPRAGTYWFSAHICSYGNSYLCPSIFIRGVLTSRTWVRDLDYATCGYVAVVSVLAESDEVCLKSGPLQKTHSASTNVVWTDSTYLFNNFMGTIIN